MSNDPLRTYFQLATGITEATLAKAKDAAKALLNELDLSGIQADPRAKLNDLADDMMAQSKANRDALTSMIRGEVDKAVGRLGFVREEELAALRAHVLRLEAQLAKGGAAGGASKATPVKKNPARKSSARKTSASNTVKKSSGSAPRKSAAKKKSV